MKSITLTQNQVAKVDDEDEDLAKFNWCAAKTGTGNDFYALRAVYDPKSRTIYLHRVILARILGRELTRKDFCDHINGDTLDNRRSNIRLVSHKQNNRNAYKRHPKTSIYKGVYWRANRRTWMSTIRFDGKLIYIGNFHSEIEAAKAYDLKAKELFGEYARLNFP